MKIFLILLTLYMGGCVQSPTSGAKGSSADSSGLTGLPGSTALCTPTTTKIVISSLDTDLDSLKIYSSLSSSTGFTLLKPIPVTAQDWVPAQNKFTKEITFDSLGLDPCKATYVYLVALDKLQNQSTRTSTVCWGTLCPK